MHVQSIVRDANYFPSVFANLSLQNDHLQQAQSSPVLRNLPKKKKAHVKSHKYTTLHRHKAELRLKLKIYNNKEATRLYRSSGYSHYPTALQARRRAKGVAHQLTVLCKISRRLLRKYLFLKKIYFSKIQSKGQL